ncbi:glycosyltransferase family 4 protein [Roseibacillus persicicus]|uniref:glycosyltransferase family 4 protein n=1 Tax=Roseibacillus persicicus TaxID=454148 RepID=UPI00280FBD53|nr:glycosyltransferase family 4 protein [Roseibacillus persicicus]MDQ8190600.1 glycosyltransferase family 4 protein [Roseibacillus persicicus]
MILLSHPTGNSNVRNALLALDQEGLLAEGHVSILTRPGNLFDKLGKLPGLSDFTRRSFPASLAGKIEGHPLKELGRLAASKAGLRSMVAHERGVFCVDAVYHSLDRSVAKRLRSVGVSGGISGVYCYEDGALQTFQAARKLGIQTIYDLPIGYWRAGQRIQSEEAERLPEWANTMPALIDSEEKLARKDEELRLAGQILVASSFTAQTLQDAPFELPEPLVIPYGCPPVLNHHTIRETEVGGVNSPLKVLFVGGLSQRKGLSYLFEAVKQLRSLVELTVIGRKPDVVCRPLDEGIGSCRYIPSLSHEQILAEMDRQDVFVFPSLFEGFGLVITEALSRGLPVITTSHTCGPDVLTDGVDGFLVPIRRAEAIAEKLELLHRERSLLAAMKAAALEKARHLSWEMYRASVSAAVKAG